MTGTTKSPAMISALTRFPGNPMTAFPEQAPRMVGLSRFDVDAVHQHTWLAHLLDGRRGQIARAGGGPRGDHHQVARVQRPAEGALQRPGLVGENAVAPRFSTVFFDQGAE
jgi:hypothetical protein